MKIVQAGSLLLIVLAAVCVVGGMAVPSLWQVSRSTIIAKRPEAIYPYLASLKKWEQWSVWTKKKDPTLNYVYEGPEIGAGARQRWTSQKMGDGWLEITEAHLEKALRISFSSIWAAFSPTSMAPFSWSPGELIQR